MSGDSYFRHRVIMEVGTKKHTAKDKQIDNFKDDHELLDYLREQEKLDLKEDMLRNSKIRGSSD